MTRKEINNFGIRKYKNTRKFIVWFSIASSIVLIGILIAVLIDLDREFKRNNVGKFEISLSNSGAVVAEDVREIELTNVKIGQSEVIKFSFGLKDCTRTQTYANDENQTPIENGVFVRLWLTGEVYDVSSTGEQTLNSTLTTKLAEIISTSPQNSAKWQKHANYFYYADYSKGENNGPSLVTLNSNITSRSDILILFNTSLVNGEWYSKVIKIKVHFEAIDHLDPDADLWRDK